jgi:hypothetical protein
MPKLIIVFFLFEVIIQLAKFSQFEYLHAKKEKNSNLRIMKTDSSYKSHKGSGITKLRLTYKFVEIRVSLNYTK